METNELCVSQLPLSQNKQGNNLEGRAEVHSHLGFQSIVGWNLCFWVSEAEHYGGRVWQRTSAHIMVAGSGGEPP